MTTSIQKNVMRRVQIMRTLDTLLSPTLLSVAVSMVALWGVGREVWVARVLQNAPAFQNISADVRFYLNAFMNTRLPVQLLLLLAGAAICWSLYTHIRRLKFVAYTFA